MKTTLSQNTITEYSVTQTVRQEVPKNIILSGYQYLSSVQNYRSLFQRGNWKSVLSCPNRPICGGVKRELKKLSLCSLWVLLAVSFSTV
jgi:hypothetical protein